jgi:phosphoglycolate phosphatase
VKKKIEYWLSKLSFRTGVIVLAMYAVCILIAFFPVIPWIKDWWVFTAMSPYVKGLWWTAWFGLAHVFKYAGITILGIEGCKRLRAYFKRKKQAD